MTILRRRDLAFRTRRGQIAARFVTGAKASEPEVERWLAQWETQARLTGMGQASPAYWATGLRWIAQQRESPPGTSEVA
jgi:hypothetical protein